MTLARALPLLVALVSVPALAQSTKVPRTALWIQPIPSLVLGISGVGLYLSGGVQHALSNHVDVALGLSGYRVLYESSVDQAIAADVSLVFRPFAQRALTSFFFALKAGGAHGWGLPTGQPTWMVQVGLDLGWQFVWGPVFFAPVVGVAYLPVLSGSEDIPFAAMVAPVGASRFAVNLNLLRLGVAF
ncbi:MAG: hypothetical protein ACKVPX_14140 [Myxococcaceae bacterium]